MECTLRLKLITGGYRWCRMIGLYYKDENGTPAHTIGIIIDVDSEHAYSVEMSNLINTVPTGIGIFDVNESGITENYLNDTFYRLIGTKREERAQFVGLNALATTHPDDVAKLRQAMKQMVDGSAATGN